MYHVSTSSFPLVSLALVEATPAEVAALGLRPAGPEVEKATNEAFNFSPYQFFGW